MYIVDPKQAKELALFFLGATEQKVEPKKVAYSVNQAKNLLKKYQYDHLIKAIQHYVENPPRGKINSLRYFFYVMDEWTEIMLTKEEQKRVKKNFDDNKFVRSLDNLAKTQRNNDKSRFGKKYNFDMFEEPR